MRLFEQYDDILTVDELCKILQIGKTSTYKLLKQQKIKSIKIGNSYRIPKLWLIDYIEEKKI